MVLATVVAFNTIIYVGLTLSKLIPMPQQFHPSRVRAWLRGLGADQDKETAVNDIPRPGQPETDNPYENMRRAIARRDIPQAFGLVGGIVIMLSTAAMVFFRGVGFSFQLVELGVGVMFLLAAQILGWRHIRAVTVVWTWSMACVLLVAMMAVEAIRVDQELPLPYSLIVMTAITPITLAWHPSIATAGLMLTCVVVAAIVVADDDRGRLIAAAVAGLLVCATLLRLRLVALDALADEKARSTALLPTDVLTGVLSRHGLLGQMPGMPGLCRTAGRIGVRDVLRRRQSREGERAVRDAVRRRRASRSNKHDPGACTFERSRRAMGR